jgi:Methyltransferase FkbM domain
MTKYSQFDEQEHILQALRDVVHADGSPFRFLDIGAWDPITFSNTRALVELGWSGVMIEPAPGPFLELLRCCTKCGVGVDVRAREVYGKRQQRECDKCGSLRYGFDLRFTLILGAVGTEAGFTRICATDDALSTSNAKSLETWDKLGGFYGWLLTPTITLEDIANRFGGFDFVNIDVEGTSTELLLKMLQLGWQPKCICVETDGRDQEILSAATPLHYHCTYANGTNLVLVRQG